MMTLTNADLVDRAQTGGMDEIDDPAPRPRRRRFTAEEKLAHLDTVFQAAEKVQSPDG